MESKDKCFNIKIVNYNNYDTIDYNLILLKGEVISNDCCEQLYISIKDNNTIVNVKEKKFKLLIELDEGENSIVFKSCCTIVYIFILYFKTKKTIYTVLPLYIICEGHDGRFQAPENEDNSVESALKRIFLSSRLIQLLYAENFYQIGMKRKTFLLETPCIHYSKLNFEKARNMSQTDLWYYFAREIMSSSLGSNTRKFLAFLSCTNYRGDKYKGVENIFKLTEAYVAFGGENLALLGTGCLYTWPEKVEKVIQKFEDMRKVDQSKFLNDSCFRNTLGGCFATTLGAALHELSHTFGLGHTEEGVMGRGFDNVQNEFLLKECNIPLKNNLALFSCGVKLEFLTKCNSIPTCIFWTRSCNFLLFYHKWFNFGQISPFQLHFDQVSSIIKSTCGIRVVEIRKKCDELVLHHWIFPERVLKFFFQIPPNLSVNSEDILYVEDNCGNILKQTIK